MKLQENFFCSDHGRRKRERARGRGSARERARERESARERMRERGLPHTFTVKFSPHLLSVSALIKAVCAPALPRLSSFQLDEGVFQRLCPQKYRALARPAGCVLNGAVLLCSLWGGYMDNIGLRSSAGSGTQINHASMDFQEGCNLKRCYAKVRPCRSDHWLGSGRTLM